MKWWKKLSITAAAAFVVASVATLVLTLILQEWHRSHDEAAARKIEEELPEALVVYCFHDNRQDEKDEKIERFTREVLETSFAAPLKEGRLVWRVVNFEDPENAFLADKYLLASTCIVVVDGRPGRSRAWKGYYQKTWDLVGDERVFKEFMRGEIQKAFDEVNKKPQEPRKPY